MKFDSHVHSAVSPDSEMAPREAVFLMRRKNMGLIFTEHVDYVTPVDKADPNAGDLPKTYNKDFVADFSVYPSGYEKLRAKDVLLGLEVGLTKAYANLNKQTVEEYDYDFVIGSVHYVDGHDIYADFFGRPHFDDHYRRMLEYSYEVVEASGFFDSFGHIDYTSRVSTLPEKNVLYERYADEYDALLKLLAERGTALEINTVRLDDEAAAANLLKICRRFGELGGRYVTIGSDSHSTGRLGKGFSTAEQIAETAGLTPVYFKKRKVEVF